MIVVELSPDPGSFEPWDVVADANGEFDTSWYIFSEEFIGATLQATATGQSSHLTASAMFTDAVTAAIYENSGLTIQRDAFAWGSTVYAQAYGRYEHQCDRVEWFDPDNIVASTEDVLVKATTIPIASFTIPATGPSGSGATPGLSK